jgi:UDP-N-acetylglucosamine--N-acetylmuramyl-(pentapeptide) pyrophosphoryl-undecaprenol N-acetylglucosamine transferase
MTKQKNIFLLAGRTGGPLIPLIAIGDKLSQSDQNIHKIIIGVRNGFEETVARQSNIKIVYLPESKLNIFSFKKQNLGQIIVNFIDTITNLFRLTFSIFKSVYLLIKYKPSLILSAGSFLAVPMIYSCKFLNTLGLLKTKIVVHQQDPIAGLANRLTAKYANLLSYVFDYTKDKYLIFKNAIKIPNPIDINKYSKLPSQSSISSSPFQSDKLNTFFQNLDKQKKTFLIFGGGSGAKAINSWVWTNLDLLLQKYNVIHLFGSLQDFDKDFVITQKTGYLSLPSVIEDMPLLIYKSDLILCRAGLGSITELDFLDKVAFLVPIPLSHQELNAQVVKDKFTILDQNQSQNWLDQIDNRLSTLQQNSTEDIIENTSKKQVLIAEKLDNYYQKILDLT